MADSPNGERPSIRPSLRVARSESVGALLDRPLEDEGRVLDALVSGLNAGEPMRDLFGRLHDAALAQGRVERLAAAYERVAKEGRIRLLPKAKQAELFLAASRFSSDIASDIDTAIAYAERAAQLKPDDEEIFDQLETLLASAQEGARLAKLYADAAPRAKEAKDQLRLLRAAVELLEAYAGSTDEIVRLHRRIVELDPEDRSSFETLERMFSASRRFRELAELLEQALARAGQEPGSDEARFKLVTLYRGELRDPTKAVPHVEMLLSHEPIDPAALQAAEALIDHRPSAVRIAPLLSEAYRRLGRLEDEASTLCLELKLARPPRLADVHRRLALLRQDVLGDPSGALELLEPLVARDPSDSDLRRRYIEVTTTFHREVEAAKLLTRAVANAKDLDVRATVALDIAALYAKQGDVRRARAALDPFLDEQTLDDVRRLALAKRLVELNDDGAEPKALARALEATIRLEPDLPSRIAAAKRLVELCEGPLDDPALSITAWRALLASPRVEEALDRLEGLYTRTGDDAGLIDVLLERAARSEDRNAARGFAFRAAELRAARAPDRLRAIEVFRDVLGGFGPSRDALSRLATLLEQQRDHRELAPTLALLAEHARPEERAATLSRLAKVRLVDLRDGKGALAALAAALAADPKEPAARKLAEKMLADGEDRLEAAALIEPIYRAEGNHAGTVRVLAVRALLDSDPEKRLSVLDEAHAIVETHLSDPRRLLEIAGHGLAEAAQGRLAQVPWWLERFRVAAARAGDPARRAELLTVAVRGIAVDRGVAAELVREAAEALVAAGDLARGIEAYRLVLAFEPSSAELLRRLDELLAQQGSPGDRLSLYRTALARTDDGGRRRELLHTIARIQRRDVGDLAGAVDTLTELVSAYPADFAAHEALVEVLEAVGDAGALVQELRRAADLAPAEQRASLRLRLARSEAATGDPKSALARYRALLVADELPREALLEMEELAASLGDEEALVEALERRVQRAADEREQLSALERLGEVKTARDPAVAEDVFLRAARLARDVDGARATSVRLYERVLELSREDREAARFLLEEYATTANFGAARRVLSVLLGGDSAHEAVDGLLLLESAASTPESVRDLVAMVDAALAAEGADVVPRARELMGLRARVLASLPETRAAAAASFRAVVERFEESSDAEAFRRFLDAVGPEVVSNSERRWLFEWRVAHAVDKVQVLVEWAATEELLMDDAERAAAVYEEVLAVDPSHAGALSALVRIETAASRGERLLGVLDALRVRLPSEEATPVMLRMASLLVEPLGRTAEALPLLCEVLARAPDDEEAIRIARVGLRARECRDEVARLLDGAVRAAEGETGTALLVSLLDEARAMPELAALRAAWYERLVELTAANPPRALSHAVAAAEEMPYRDALWDAAERCARKVGDPRSVADAYARVLAQPLGAPEGEAIGRRIVEFHEEWFDEPDVVQKLLERVLVISPRARWALDRIKLSYNAEARWDDLFALYDRAIDGAVDDREREDLLDEAALAAKDLANDQPRAIAYLERLYSLRPEPRVEALLERMYDRAGRTRELIGLLGRRAKALTGRELARVELRLARLWLELGDGTVSLELVERALGMDGDEPEAYALLERLVKLPAPPASGKKAKKRSRLDPRQEAVRILEARYRATRDDAGLARTLEAALELADSPAERIRRLEELLSLHLDALGDPERALGHLMTLVTLAPREPTYRERLAALAGRLGAEARRAEHLVRVAGTAETTVALSLLREAALVFERQGDGSSAKRAYFLAMDRCRGDDATTLEFARAVEPVLERLGLSLERCDVLERVVELEQDAAERRAARAVVGRVAFEELGDAERAARAYRASVAEDPRDVDALNGLERVLDAAGLHAELVGVLESRARLTVGPSARADRVRVARLQANELADRAAAIETWRNVRADFGPDEETFDALYALYESEARWDELSGLVARAAEAAVPDGRRVALYRLLGDLHRDRTGKPVLAVEAYVRARDFERTITLGDVLADRQLAVSVASRLLDLAVEAWPSAPPEREPSVARAARFAIETLVRRHLEAGEVERVVETELRGASLPFERGFTRRLKRDAAFTTCDRLKDPDRAIGILEDLFTEDPADEIATGAVTRFALLLSDGGRTAELARLWEQQAKCRAEALDRVGAALLWARAAGIWETELRNVDRAVAAYRQGAALGGEASLEALARIYTEQRSWRAAATALEWLSAQSSREELAARVLALADSYLALGEWERAQARLEHAAATAIDASSVRKRLAELYRRHSEWAPLADLLVAEAERAADDRSRVVLLREAAALHTGERADPARAVPLLERAVEIDPEEPALRLSLSEALRASGRYDDAATVLRAQIERYGHRRPKDRALVHLYLARVSLTRGSRADALTELEVGAKINPMHPGILYELGRVAFAEGQLARAESTYRALLLVLRKPDGDPGEAPARSEVYLDLSEVAAVQGNPERAAEFLESAFEAALDSPTDAAALENALRGASRLVLLARAIENRVRVAPDPATAARALSDLVLLHAGHVEPPLGRSAAPRVGKEAAHIHRTLEARAVLDPNAWAALTAVYEWLGDPAGEAQALEHRVEAELRRGGSLDVEPVLRLARLRLADPARRDEGVILVERALDAGADSSRAWELLYDSGVAAEGHRGILRLLERIAREPGRERGFVDVAVLQARAGSLGAAGLREAVALAEQLGDEASRVALLDETAERAEAYGPDDRAWLLEELARVRTEEGRFDAAVELLERAAELAPSSKKRALDVEAARLAAGQLGDLARAARLYARALSVDPSDRGVWEPLLDVYRRQGERAKLIALIDSTAPLVDSPKDRSRLRFEEATLMLADPERADDAVRLLERIVEEDATMAAAAELLATLLERQGRLGELVGLVATQLDVARSGGDAAAVEGLSLKLGALLERSGERERALAAYAAVLDWNATCREALRAVVRLEDVPGRQRELADAIECLLPVEERALAAPLSTRLVELRAAEGDAPAYERALETACAANPTDVAAREQLIGRYFERGDWVRGADALFRAFEADVRDLPLLLRAADAYERGGEPERAVEALSAFGDDADQPELHIERARLYVALGAPGAAIDSFRAAGAAGARSDELLEALGAAIDESEGDAATDYTLALVDVLESAGEATLARERLGQLLKTHPRHRDALRRLASICAGEARWDEAAAIYRRLIPLEDGDSVVGAAMNLADACEQSGRLADARGGLERALVALPDNAELRTRLREIYERTGASRELAELLTREARAETDKAARATLLVRAAELLLERSESSRAIAVLEDVRQESPEHILGAVLYARALAATGRPEEAMTTLEGIVALHRGRRYRELSLAHQEISNVHLEAGDLSQALDALSKAFDLDMRNGELAMQLGHLALDVDDKPAAAKALRAVTMMKVRQPGSTEGASTDAKAVAYYHLSRIAQAEGDLRRARLMATKAVGENPRHAEAQELLRELTAG